MTRFRQRPVPVDAIQYRPDIPNCRDVWAFLGWEWDGTQCFSHDSDDHDEELSVPVDNWQGATVHPGYWWVRRGSGRLDVLTPDEFTAEIEEGE